MTSNELDLGATVQVKKTGMIGRVAGRNEATGTYYVQIGEVADWYDRVEIKRASAFETKAADARELQKIFEAGDVSHPRWQAVRDMKNAEFARFDRD